MVDRMAKFQGIAAHVGGVIWVPVAVLVTALIGMIALSTVFGGKVGFNTAFSIASYAYLIIIPETLILSIMVLFGDPQHIVSNPQNPAPVTVGFFLDPATTSKPLMSLAGSVDIFTFWLMAVLAIGFAAASARRAKASSMFFVYFGLWVVWTLIKMGLSTLSG
jgi:Yip1 domain